MKRLLMVSCLAGLAALGASAPVLANGTVNGAAAGAVGGAVVAGPVGAVVGGVGGAVIGHHYDEHHHATTTHHYHHVQHHTAASTTSSTATSTTAAPSPLTARAGPLGLLGQVGGGPAAAQGGDQVDGGGQPAGLDAEAGVCRRRAPWPGR